MFTIYSIGDSVFLAQILNALAMICGTGDFEQLVAIGLLLGFLVMGFQCIMSGTRQFNLHQVFLGFLCYLCFFGPSVTVHIEDAYTGNVRSVDNVPIGAGVAGTLISSVGYGVTQLFEQGYSDVDRMTERAFGESLQLLNNVRSLSYDASIVDAASTALGPDSDLRKTLDNYMRECTMLKIVVGQGTPEEIYTGGFDALGFQSTIYGTQVFLPGQNGTNMDCAAAWQQLKPRFLQAVDSPQAAAALNRLAGARDAQGQIQTSYDKITDSLEALGASQVAARDYVSLALLEPIYKRSAQGFYNDMGDYATAVMLNQAIEQRNTQWAAEQSLFMTTIRPLMTFFEGFIYAITPILAFLLVMGAFGMTMITKYFQVVVWIQLWMPVLSVVNLFTLMGARGEFSSIVTTPLSFYSINNGSQILQNWIATGGMLAAATPMIALFLVTGSTYAFTSLTSRMGGADHINEKIGSPDMVKPAEVLSMMPKATSSTIGGTSATGSVVPTIDIQRGLSDNVSAAKTNLQTNSEALAQNFVKTSSDQQIRQVAAALSKVTGNQEFARLAQTYGTGDGENYQASTQAETTTGVTEATSGSMSGDVGLSTQEGRTVSNGTRVQANTKELKAYEKANAAYNAARGVVAGSSTSVPAAASASAPAAASTPAAGSKLSVGAEPAGGAASNKLQVKPSETIDVPAGGDMKSRGFGAKVGLQGNGQLSGSASDGHNLKDSYGKGTGTNFTQEERAELGKMFSTGFQNMNSEQFSRLQGELNQEGISLNLSNVVAAQESYSKAVSASNSLALRTNGQLNEIVGEIAQNPQAANELRSQVIAMSPSEKDAINRLADKYHNVNLFSDPQARDMAIAEHMANSGRLSEVASIYAHSKGIDSPIIHGPGRNNIPQPRAVDKSAGSKLNGASFDSKRFDAGFKSAWAANDRGQKYVDQGGKAILADVQKTVDKNLENVQKKQIEKAVHNLSQPINANLGEAFAGLYEVAWNFGWSNVDPNETARELMHVAGLTASQAQYMTHNMRVANLKNPWDGQYAKAVFAETKAMLGYAQDDHSADGYVQSITDNMIKRMNVATTTGIDTGGIGFLAPIKEFNDAVRGPSKSHTIFDGVAAEPKPLASPSPGVKPSHSDYLGGIGGSLSAVTPVSADSWPSGKTADTAFSESDHGNTAPQSATEQGTVFQPVSPSADSEVGVVSSPMYDGTTFGRGASLRRIDGSLSAVTPVSADSEPSGKKADTAFSGSDRRNMAPQRAAELQPVSPSTDSKVGVGISPMYGSTSLRHSPSLDGIEGSLNAVTPASADSGPSGKKADTAFSESVRRNTAPQSVKEQGTAFQPVSSSADSEVGVGISPMYDSTSLGHSPSLGGIEGSLNAVTPASASGSSGATTDTSFSGNDHGNAAPWRATEQETVFQPVSPSTDSEVGVGISPMYGSTSLGHSPSLDGIESSLSAVTSASASGPSGATADTSFSETDNGNTAPPRRAMEQRKVFQPVSPSTDPEVGVGISPMYGSRSFGSSAGSFDGFQLIGDNGGTLGDFVVSAALPTMASPNETAQDRDAFGAVAFGATKLSFGSEIQSSALLNAQEAKEPPKDFVGSSISFGPSVAGKVAKTGKPAEIDVKLSVRFAERRMFDAATASGDGVKVKTIVVGGVEVNSFSDIGKNDQ